jgi:acid phosphatase family membrane protein YuiD
MTGLAAWPTWAVVVACGSLTQILKLIAYSVVRRELIPSALFQGNGLPSLPAVLPACLLVMVVQRHAWNSSAAAFALVFAVLVVHDTVKLSGLADRQRAVVHLMLTSVDDGDATGGPVADFLDPRAHHPAHVAAGVVLGALFALAFGTAPR